ncbi:MAG: universal stress protein [Alphaproteobacteria bacterium]|nr:universal stress protein [Alphaproteobacteria bacterium]
MNDILIPCDGSKNSLAAVKYAIELIQLTKGGRLHLLNVQPPLPSVTQLGLSQTAIRTYHQEEGDTALRKARAAVDKAKIAFESHIAVGDIAEQIIGYVRSRKCTQIVMGSRGLSAIPGVLLGSVATKVLHHATVPVTVVK